MTLAAARRSRPYAIALIAAALIVFFPGFNHDHDSPTGAAASSVSAVGASDGLPAGNISFVGLPGSDARLLALAHSYEQHSKRFVAPPNPV